MVGSARTVSITTDAPMMPVAAARIVPISVTASARPPGTTRSIFCRLINRSSAMRVRSITSPMKMNIGAATSTGFSMMPPKMRLGMSVSCAKRISPDISARPPKISVTPIRTTPTGNDEKSPAISARNIRPGRISISMSISARPRIEGHGRGRVVAVERIVQEVGPRQCHADAQRDRQGAKRRQHRRQRNGRLDDPAIGQAHAAHRAFVADKGALGEVVAEPEQEHAERKDEEDDGPEFQMQAEAVGHAMNEDVDPHMGVAHVGIAETQDGDGAVQVPFEVGDHERAGVEEPPPDHVIHDHRRQQQQHEARQPREQVAGQGNDVPDA
jgi:hypothetical protein